MSSSDDFFLDAGQAGREFRLADVQAFEPDDVANEVAREPLRAHLVDHQFL